MAILRRSGEVAYFIISDWRPVRGVLAKRFRAKSGECFCGPSGLVHALALTGEEYCHQRFSFEFPLFSKLLFTRSKAEKGEPMEGRRPGDLRDADRL